jgi:hypothetical protein
VAAKLLRKSTSSFACATSASQRRRSAAIRALSGARAAMLARL